MTPNLSYNRLERIRRLERKLERTSERLVQRYSHSDLSQFSKIEREIEVQKAYLQIEAQELH
jgi:hypothetical protein